MWDVSVSNLALSSKKTEQKSYNLYDPQNRLQAVATASSSCDAQLFSVNRSSKSVAVQSQLKSDEVLTGKKRREEVVGV